ncbi:MAG: hypothetical protein M2R45_05249 [Verrucomicrobia subdivision 3 bacterium]|nr:hypothetical protein [Limisphaerales bacterium]MCS1416848.1 hypothetical protein [Limisphaerales bacterium]
MEMGSLQITGRCWQMPGVAMRRSLSLGRGRISAPGYRVASEEVKLYWDGKTDDLAYKIMSGRLKFRSSPPTSLLGFALMLSIRWRSRPWCWLLFYQVRTARGFNFSSLMLRFTAEDLKAAGPAYSQTIAHDRICCG